MKAPLAAGTSVGNPTFGGRMDDKSLNLWRQIEGCRRAKKIVERRGKPVSQLAAAAANDPA